MSENHGYPGCLPGCSSVGASAPDNTLKSLSKIQSYSAL